MIFCAHLVPVKCKVFTTTSTREIQLCARPTTQLTCSPLLPADFTRQSIAHARKLKRTGLLDFNVLSTTQGHLRTVKLRSLANTISKLFSHIYIYKPSVKSIYKTSHFTNIKHTYTNIRHKFSKLVPSILPLLKEHIRLGHAGIVGHSV